MHPNCLDCLLQRSNSHAARRSHRSVPFIQRNRALEVRGTRAQPSRPAYHKRPTAKGRRCLTQRAGIASPHAEGDVLSGVARDGEVNAFISEPTAFVGGVPLMRARNPWAIPEAST